MHRRVLRPYSCPWLRTPWPGSLRRPLCSRTRRTCLQGWLRRAFSPGLHCFAIYRQARRCLGGQASFRGCCRSLRADTRTERHSPDGPQTAPPDQPDTPWTNRASLCPAPIPGGDGLRHFRRAMSLSPAKRRGCPSWPPAQEARRLVRGLLYPGGGRRKGLVLELPSHNAARRSLSFAIRRGRPAGISRPAFAHTAAARAYRSEPRPARSQPALT